MSDWTCPGEDILLAVISASALVSSTDYDPIAPTHTPCKTSPSPHQADQNQMTRLNLFYQPGSLAIYNCFSGLNPSEGPALVNGTIDLIARSDAWMFTVLNTSVPSSQNVSLCSQTEAIWRFSRQVAQTG